MAVIDTVLFADSNGALLSVCTVDTTKIVKLAVSLTGGTSEQHSKLIKLSLDVYAVGTYTRLKLFTWTGECVLINGKSYTFYTTSFTLPIGSWRCGWLNINAPQLDKTLGECSITIPEVTLT